ncbi:tRNA epoxyqueuosine(34) reductase QueG [Vibrio sp. 10N.286.49.C2]|uniref:tRNA epoxyqueuosine(34) reductase QueG n=1 Tax=unclassified Vibrio TaxID=2614977 RepID=UPI000C8577B0|nr:MULTISPECIES: tRNA epoxyqueuosine(34) reductase QueG [unclassified Vibrio]PMH41856.1 tRNA epoxyqueuosine(34) reductase QueG [Vibrio sp. 10N.286.49.C2]PMH48169.1 tRNA epoxyqueuosine(34) reductase QueG [Vibrio sp. 10N.286.49.B1]PMH81148.1 tRNA epoxyqueuosine(34) reductase QueG [Vibrio sp. 10N.286.48.B7]
MDLEKLANDIKSWAKELGFQKAGISDIALEDQEASLTRWIEAGYHGEMAWMESNQDLRIHPDKLHPNTCRIISVRMNYLPEDAHFASNLEDKHTGYISRYALGRDYHKLIRNQLKKLGQKIEHEVGTLGYRPFVDSAPVLERPLAEKAGLGWTGKHSLILDQEAGSWFFLGELFIDLPLPVDKAVENQCGKCTACVTSCPTNAILEDGVVDARRCISYLTIEYDGIIPEEFRDAIGNRIYGCDDCQLVCPWNRFSKLSPQADFQRRPVFKDLDLTTLLTWDEATFLKNMEGSAIRRIGHQQWQRNIIIAMGNASFKQAYVVLLEQLKGHSTLLDVHIDWALNKLHAQIDTPLLKKIDIRNQRLIRIVQKGLTRDS